MLLTDTITLDGVRRTADGYLIASANIARTGIQIYSGREVGRPDLTRVRVYRPEAEVFKRDTLESFTSMPITLDHPPESVSAKNWRKFAHGFTGESVARDGGFVHVPLALKDQAAIAAYEGGKRELSCGYTTDLKWESGTSPEGETYDAVQTNIRGNHLAIVSAGRAGSECRLGDGNEGEKAMTTRTITVDGLSVEMADKDAQIVQRALDSAAKAIGDAEAKATADATRMGELTAQVSTKDGEIAALKQKVADAELTPAKLDVAVADRARVVAAAKRILGDAFVTDGKPDAELRKAAVEAKLGDAAKDMSDAEIGGAFKVLADVKDARPDPLRQVLSAAPVNVGDAKSKAEEARKKREDELRNGWKAKAA